MRTRPTPIGRAAIKPAPLTIAQIENLVVRTRVNEIIARSAHVLIAGKASGLARRLAFRMTPSRIAAHLKAFTGWSFPVSAAAVREVTRLRLSTSGVHHAFHKLYPNARLWASRPGVSRAAFEAGGRP